MACSNVFDAFALATENLSDEVYRNASYRSIWLNAIPRGTFETGAGVTKTTFSIENSEIADANDAEGWTTVTAGGIGGSSGGGAGGSCIPATYNDVEVGYTSRSYSPEEFNLRGPLLCKDDLIYDHNVDTFLRAYIEEMTKRAQRSWEKRYEELYMKFSTKLSVGTGQGFIDFSEDANFVSSVDFEANGGIGASDSTLTQQLLDKVAIELIDRGATNPDSNGFITYGEDGPVFPLLIGLEASQQIAMNNAELRADFRSADTGAGAGAELMKRMGASRQIKNFRHVPNIRPPRYTYTGIGNHYQRVATYLMSSATSGKKAVLNPDYVTAPYEAAIVLNPAVFTSEIVPPVNAAGGVSWNPTSYMGEWQWVTGGSKVDEGGDCGDPLDKLGRHYAEFKHAARPEFPQHGMTLIFKRACLPATGNVSITEVTSCSA